MTIAVFLIVFMGAGGNGKADNDNLRSGQAHHAIDDSAPVPPSSGYGDNLDSTSSIMMQEEGLQEAIEEASSDIHEAEEEELSIEQDKLKTEATGITNFLRVRMGSLFGSTLTAEEVNEVANQVEEQLSSEASATLRSEADAIADQEIEDVENLVDTEEEAGLDAADIESDVLEQEAMSVGDVRSGIDMAAMDVKGSLKARAAEIEKEILEERLSAKLGKRVKLVIMDDEVQGVDELLTGLNNLAPGAPVTQAYNPYSAAPPPQQPAATTSSYYGAPPAQPVTPAYGSASTSTSTAYGAAAPAQPATAYEAAAQEQGDGDDENAGDDDNAAESGDDEKEEKPQKSKGWWNL